MGVLGLICVALGVHDVKVECIVQLEQTDEMVGGRCDAPGAVKTLGEQEFMADFRWPRCSLRIVHLVMGAHSLSYIRLH